MTDNIKNAIDALTLTSGALNFISNEIKVDTLSPDQIRNILDGAAIVINKAITAVQEPVNLIALKRDAVIIFLDAYQYGGFEDHLRLRDSVYALMDNLHAQGYLNTKREGYALVPIEPTENLLRALSESKASCSECPEYESLGDHLGYSGENKIRIVLRAAYKAMIQAAIGYERGE